MILVILVMLLVRLDIANELGNLKLDTLHWYTSLVYQIDRAWLWPFNNEPVLANSLQSWLLGVNPGITPAA